ncbi:hypothetical protein D3C83_36620 [compost metagenome]
MPIVKTFPRGSVNRRVKSMRISPNTRLMPTPASVYHPGVVVAKGSDVPGRFHERAAEPWIRSSMLFS